MRVSSLLLLPLLVQAVACGDGAPAAPRRFWSMAELEHESTLSSCDNPGGLPCNYFVAPASDAPNVLQFKLAFSEHQPMGYLTTDFWANYDRIWLQPMYILVTAWNEALPANNRLKDANGALAPPIFSVGPQSAFYSPFWSVFYVVVPVGTPADKYTNTRRLFDEHLEMHQGANRFAAIAPDDVSLPTKDGLPDRFAPHITDYLKKSATDPDGTMALAAVLASAKTLIGWVDGASRKYFDFGTDNFSADAAQVVQDAPLFVFVRRTTMPDGTPNYLSSPNVGGVGPLFSGATAKLTGTGRPQFGALWRLYLVTLPETADFLTPQKVTAGMAADPTVFADKVYRVALNAASCFDDLVAGKGDKCTWLDSQGAIEQYIGASGITRTTLQPACPFVMFNGIPVTNP